MRNMKRILSVKIVRACDESPDTSHLGEYSNLSDSKYAIDRAHTDDCNSLEENHGAAKKMLEDADAYLSSLELDEGVQAASDILCGLADDIAECDCTRAGHWNNREYRYFNPNYQNYEVCTEEEIRKYCRQDYNRMESLNNGQWYYIGIYVTAKVTFGNDSRGNSIVQKIRSGGLWGIESDSHKSYFEEVSKEEMTDLRRELESAGFSKRAISKAFQDMEEVEE